MTHDEAVKTIREALRVAAMWIPDDSSGDTKTLFKSIAALDLLAKTSKQESSEDTREFAQEVFSAIENVCKVDGYKKAAALITARDERIRRECADRGVEWYTQVFCIPNNEKRVEKLTRGLRNYIMGEAKK